MQITSQTTFDYRKYWNVVKGIAIVSMVLGHAIQFGGGSDYYNSLAYFDNIVFRCIYGCHMPLLIFVSGYLFAFSIRKYPLSALCHKKVMSLLLPLIVNVSILMLLYESNYSSLGGAKIYLYAYYLLFAEEIMVLVGCFILYDICCCH